VRYLTHSPLFRVPAGEGGISIADVDDVVRGHVHAMERGRVGERYALGGENLSYEQVIDALSELTGLAPPVKKAASSLVFSAQLARLGTRWSGKVPVFDAAGLRRYADAHVWIDSAKAKSELGYEFRPARQALMRAVRWFLEQGFVATRAARRVRLELSAG
jgi:dihydroflavonol-4-reductase